MKKLVFALPALVPVLLALHPGSASAQVPGSYLDSCRRVRQSGPILNAECRGSGNRYYSTTIDTSRCRGNQVANTFGRLTCGNVQGSASQVRGGNYDDDDNGYQPRRPRYGGDDNGYAPRYGSRPRYAPDDDDDAPPPRRRPRYYQPDDDDD